jgi:hypothetical protein
VQGKHVVGRAEAVSRIRAAADARCGWHRRAQILLTTSAIGPCIAVCYTVTCLQIYFYPNPNPKPTGIASRHAEQDAL